MSLKSATVLIAAGNLDPFYELRSRLESAGVQVFTAGTTGESTITPDCAAKTERKSGRVTRRWAPVSATTGNDSGRRLELGSRTVGGR